MAIFSKTILPPILSYAYPAFTYTPKTLGETADFLAELSVVNTISQIDHLQVSIVSNNTYKNGLNKDIFKEGLYFLPIDALAISEKPTESKFLIKLLKEINGVSIFKTGVEEVYPTYYIMQIRVAGKEAHYDESWNQSPPSGWLNANAKYFSEWSNSARIKTVVEPELGIFTLQEGITNILEDTNFRWSAFYNTNDSNETLAYYAFVLKDEDGREIERSKNIYIREFETPSLAHTFSEVFENNTRYKISIEITTSTEFKTSTEYDLLTKFSYVKLYNVFDIKENDDGAYNLAELNAKQIILKLEKEDEEFIESNWLKDESINEMGEFGVTHFKLREGKLYADEDFSIPYNDFSILFSITNFKNKIMHRRRECANPQNINSYIMSFSSESMLSGKYYLCYLEEFGKHYLILVEKFASATGIEEITEYYQYELSSPIEDNREYLFLIQKKKGDTVFDVSQWNNNRFVKA